MQLPWTRLRPAPELLLNQPGSDDPENWQAVAATPERDWVVAYAPRGGSIALDPGSIPESAHARSFDPETGAWGQPSAATEATWELPSGSERDGILVLSPKS